MKQMVNFIRPRWALMIILMSGSLFFGTAPCYPQSDSIPPPAKSKFAEFLNNFELTVYVDAYYNRLINKPAGDTANILNFASDCPFANEFRLNVASLWLYYSSKNARGKLELQYGDVPNLLTDPSVQFIKYMKRAEFGFRIYKTLWIDLGYQYNPIGYESSFPIRNQLSTVTVGGYYEVGNFLGVKLSSQISPSFFLGAYLGNPYTLAYGHNKRLFAGLFMTYTYKSLLSINYNNLMGSSDLATEEKDHMGIYNNVYVTVNPVNNLLLVGQCDFGWVTNKGVPDTTKTASGVSGFLQVTYQFTKWFAASLRGEYFNDPDALMSTLYAYDGKLRGLLTYGGTVGVEFKPIKNSYIRAEYTYLTADQGNLVFSGNLSQDRNTLTFTAGYKFGFFH
ncbi:MAG: outer membrane beta-barrel protein [Bacteroidales bacterium]|nr:outer membrane beta-barrel protein [Bacteroidales bacterium]